MTQNDFQVQMNRLTETFGKAAYGTERLKLIWLELRDFDVSWFERVVSRFIGDSRQAPMLTDFRELASRERERAREGEKKRESNATVQALRGHLAGDDISMVVGSIKNMIVGKNGDAERNGLREMLVAQVRHSDSMSPPECHDCAGTGLIFKDDGVNAPWVYRCDCFRGHADPRAFPMIRRR